ncbi:MAG: putative transporter [Actinomycetia bacterium]|nr:putative transporter [Actinomycetes bacterium]
MPDAPHLLTRRFVVLIIGTFLYFTAMGTLVPTLPRYVKDELHGGGFEIGLAVGVFALVAGLLRPFAGRLGDERGRRLLIVGGSAIFAVAALGYIAATSIVLLVIARMVAGVGEAAMWVGSATTSQDLAPSDRRAEAASYFSVALYAGMAIGPTLGEALVRGPGYDTLWVVTAGLALGACLLGLQAPNQSAGRPAERGPLLQREAFAPGLVLLLGMIPFVGFSAFVPVYGERVGMDDVGPVFAAFAVCVLGIRVFGARIPDRLGVRLLGSIAVLASTIGVLVPAVWASQASVWLAVVPFAIGSALLFPALFAAALGDVSESERSRAVGTFSIFFDLAGGVGVPLLGLVVSVASIRWAFAVAAVCGVAAFLVLRRTVGAQPPAGDLASYEPSVP